MTWDPKLKLLPSKPFKQNLKTALEMFLPDALEWASAQCELPQAPATPEGIFFTRAKRRRYPVLNILLVGGDPVENDDSGEDESKQLLVEYETMSEDQEDLTDEIEASILAVRSIAREMGSPDWWGAIPEESRGDLWVAIGKERYGQRSYDSEKTFVQVGSVIITVNYTENLQQGET